MARPLSSLPKYCKGTVQHDFKSVLVTVQRVESFTLNTSSSQILLEAKNSDCLLLAASRELLVYSLKGALLASFSDHTMSISSMCVVGWFPPRSLRSVNSFRFTFGHLKMTGECRLQDSFRVVTASRDLSLRVLTWRNDGATLESRYHLLGGSHTMARYDRALLWLNSPILFYASSSERLPPPCSRGFTHVACDYSSIVASTEGKDGKDVLKAYRFTS